MPGFRSGLRDYGLLVGNYLLGLLNKKPFMHGETVDKLSPRQRQALLDEYRLSTGLGKAELPTGVGFQKYMDARASSIDAFAKVKTPDGTTLADKLKAAPAGAVTAVKDAVSEALRPTQAVQDAKQKYMDAMKELSTALANDAKVNARDVERYLYELRGEATKAITAQHDAEKTALEAKFNDAGFKGHMKTVLGAGATDAQVDELKKEMLAELEKSQKAELEKFEKGINYRIKKIHEAAQIERDRVSYLATLYTHNEDMRKEIEALHQQNRGTGGVSASFTLQEPNRALFHGMEIKDLHTLRTVTGRLIDVKKNPDGSLSSFSMTLPNRILSSSYYKSAHNNVKADMKSITDAVYATGKTAVTANIEHKDPEHALELARAAYEAALESGFDEKHITIRVNGQEKKAEDLFADNHGLLSSLKETAKKQREEREKPFDPKTQDAESNDVTYARFKKALEEGRLSDATAQEPPIVPPAGPHVQP
jgi:hypothetical protein